MDRNELIEKAQDFLTTPVRGAKAGTLATWMADFALSLETKDEWWKDGYWTPRDYRSVFFAWESDSSFSLHANGLIFRTEKESERYRRQRIARTAIHRWIAENAEKVDWKNLYIKTFPVLCNGKWEQYHWTKMYIPDWFYVYEKDYTRMMSENAAHFEVLKEGME